MSSQFISLFFNFVCLLRNHYRPVVVQRCFTSLSKFSMMFAFASCFKFLKQAPNKLHFRLILFEMMSHQCALGFCFKYIRLYFFNHSSKFRLKELPTTANFSHAKSHILGCVDAHLHLAFHGSWGRTDAPLSVGLLGTARSNLHESSWGGANITGSTQRQLSLNSLSFMCYC